MKKRKPVNIIIRGDICFECGKPVFMNHHVVPKSLGGKYTIPLCVDCHTKVHGRKLCHSGILIKKAIEKRREKGLLIGRKPGPGKSKLDSHRKKIIKMLNYEVPKTKIAAMFSCSTPNLYNWLEKNQIGFKKDV